MLESTSDKTIYYWRLVNTNVCDGEADDGRAQSCVYAMNRYLLTCMALAKGLTLHHHVVRRTLAQHERLREGPELSMFTWICLSKIRLVYCNAWIPLVRQGVPVTVGTPVRRSEHDLTSPNELLAVITLEEKHDNRKTIDWRWPYNGKKNIAMLDCNYHDLWTTHRVSIAFRWELGSWEELGSHQVVVGLYHIISITVTTFPLRKE